MPPYLSIIDVSNFSIESESELHKLAYEMVSLEE